jgi:hypothetical protein
MHPRLFGLLTLLALPLTSVMLTPAHADAQAALTINAT